MKRVKVTYIISYIDKSLGFEWVAEYISKAKFDLSFVLINPGPSVLEDFLKEKGIETYCIKYNGKKDILKVWLKLFSLIRRLRPDVVHTHLVDADLIGLTVARILRVKKRVYTRHNSNYHKKYHTSAQRLDRIANSNSTHIAAISQNVSDILIKEENVNPDKLRLVYHGFELYKFESVDPKAVDSLRVKYNPNLRSPVIGVISRYMHWKGIQYIIPAFKELLKKYPNALLILANAKQNADYQSEIEAQLSELPEDSYCEIIFENNLFALYKLFDVFVHTPIDPEIEAFGQIYVEALASGIPSIFTLSGISKEFIVNRENALVVPFKDTDSIYNSLVEILSNEPLRNDLIKNGKSSIVEKFSLNNMISALENLYLE